MTSTLFSIAAMVLFAISVQFFEFLRANLVEALNLPAFFHYEYASAYVASLAFSLACLLLYTRIRWGVWSFSHPIFSDPPSMLFYQMGRLPKAHRAYFEEHYEVRIDQRNSSE